MTSIRREARALVKQLVMPSPWSIEALCAQVGALAGRTVVLEPVRGGGPSAVVRRVADRDVITYRAGHHSSDHLVAHELGHLLAGDLDGASDLGRMVDLALQGAASVMHRSCVYGDRSERLAEAVADLIMAGARTHARSSSVARGAAATLHGFGEAMR